MRILTIDIDCPWRIAKAGEPARRIANLERTLATLTQERNDWKEASERNGDGYVYYKEKCATKELAETKLREIVEKLMTGDNAETASVLLEAHELLSTPTTTEALDSYVAEKVKEARGELQKRYDFLNARFDALVKDYELQGKALALFRKAVSELGELEIASHTLHSPPPPAQPTESHANEHDN